MDTIDQQIIFLARVRWRARRSIVIGDAEALAIDRRRSATRGRPMTHDLLATDLRSRGGTG